MIKNSPFFSLDLPLACTRALPEVKLPKYITTHQFYAKYQLPVLQDLILSPSSPTDVDTNLSNQTK